SMSRLIAAVARNNVARLPNPPQFDTVAAISAGEAKTAMGPRMIGTSMPRTSHSAVLSTVPLQTVHPDAGQYYHRTIDSSLLRTADSTTHTRPICADAY